MGDSACKELRWNLKFSIEIFQKILFFLFDLVIFDPVNPLARIWEKVIYSNWFSICKLFKYILFYDLYFYLRLGKLNHEKCIFYLRRFQTSEQWIEISEREGERICESVRSIKTKGILRRVISKIILKWTDFRNDEQRESGMFLTVWNINEL